MPPACSPKPNVAPASLPASAAVQLARTLRRKVGSLRGVRLAPSGEGTSATRAVLSRESRAGYYLDVSVSSAQYVEGTGTRASVTLIVGSYPGRNMRAMVKGTVTLQGGKGSPADKLAAAEGALQSAVRKLPSTFARLSR